MKLMLAPRHLDCISDLQAVDPKLKLVYVLGRTTTVPKPGLNIGVRLMLEHLYNFLRRNSRTVAGTFNVPKHRLLEVGVVVNICQRRRR